MENVCILCNVIEFFLWKKVTKTKRGGPSSSLKLQMTLAQSCKNTLTYLCRHPNISKKNWGRYSKGWEDQSSYKPSANPKART
jgi:hypothetical protein